MESLDREPEYAVDNIGLILKRGGIIDSNAAVLEVLGVVCAGDGAAGILILIGVVDIIDIPVTEVDLGGVTGLGLQILAKLYLGSVSHLLEIRLGVSHRNQGDGAERQVGALTGIDHCVAGLIGHGDVLHVVIKADAVDLADIGGHAGFGNGGSTGRGGGKVTHGSGLTGSLGCGGSLILAAAGGQRKQHDYYKSQCDNILLHIVNLFHIKIYNTYRYTH